MWRIVVAIILCAALSCKAQTSNFNGQSNQNIVVPSALLLTSPFPTASTPCSATQNFGLDSFYSISASRYVYTCLQLVNGAYAWSPKITAVIETRYTGATAVSANMIMSSSPCNGSQSLVCIVPSVSTGGNAGISIDAQPANSTATAHVVVFGEVLVGFSNQPIKDDLVIATGSASPGLAFDDGAISGDAVSFRIGLLGKVTAVVDASGNPFTCGATYCAMIMYLGPGMYGKQTSYQLTAAAQTAYTVNANTCVNTTVSFPTLPSGAVVIAYNANATIPATLDYPQIVPPPTTAPVAGSVTYKVCAATSLGNGTYPASTPTITVNY